MFHLAGLSHFRRCLSRRGRASLPRFSFMAFVLQQVRGPNNYAALSLFASPCVHPAPSHSVIYLRSFGSAPDRVLSPFFLLREGFSASHIDRNPIGYVLSFFRELIYLVSRFLFSSIKSYCVSPVSTGSTPRSADRLNLIFSCFAQCFSYRRLSGSFCFDFGKSILLAIPEVSSPPARTDFSPSTCLAF